MGKRWFKEETSKEEEAVVEEKKEDLEEKNEEQPEPVAPPVEPKPVIVESAQAAINPMMGTPAKVKRPSSGL